MVKVPKPPVPSAATGKKPPTPAAPSGRIGNLGAFAHPPKKKGK